MTTFPNTPRLLKGALVSIAVTNPIPQVILFQYNPDTLTRSLQAQMSGEGGERSEAQRLKGAPVETPTAGLDPARLARLNVAGGNIRNIALGAAFLAADEGVAVGMGHLLRAARSECIKMEKPLSETEVTGWR
jgi:hypothetical protein